MNNLGPSASDIREAAAKYNHPELLKLAWVSAGHYAANMVPYEKELKNRPIMYLEIGVYRCKSIGWMLDNMITHPDSVAYGVDPWNIDPKNKESWQFANMEERLTYVKGIHKNRLQLRKGYSEVVLRTPEFKNNMFDVIYIDGAHDVRHVLQDWVLTWPMLKINGIMVFDDYYLRSNNSEVKIAVDTILCGLSEVKSGSSKRSCKYELLFKNKQVGLRKIAD